MPQYRVKPGRTFGVHQAGEIVEETEWDAVPYLGTQLELAETKAPAPDFPDLDALQDLTADELIEAIRTFNPTQRAAVLAWEQAHRKRVTVIRALESGATETPPEEGKAA
jgi:hypothetical protein